MYPITRVTRGQGRKSPPQNRRHLLTNSPTWRTTAAAIRAAITPGRSSSPTSTPPGPSVWRCATKRRCTSSRASSVCAGACRSRCCQEPDVNVPLMFTKNAPRMFTKNVPGMFTENAPPMFGQNVPHMFTRMHHPAQSLPLPHPRQALSQGEEPARWRLLRRGGSPAMHCC